jgi:hypothetical protein
LPLGIGGLLCNSKIFEIRMPIPLLILKRLGRY